MGRIRRTPKRLRPAASNRSDGVHPARHASPCISLPFQAPFRSYLCVHGLVAAIFISHSSRDGTASAEMKAWLANDGYEQVFLDFDKQTGLQAGENWERRLYQEIARCHAVLLVLTPNWLDSTVLRRVHAGPCARQDDPPRCLAALGQDRVARKSRGSISSDGTRTARPISAGASARSPMRWRAASPGTSRSPYPGIPSFDSADAAIFFGRDAETRPLIERLDARRVPRAAGGRPDRRRIGLGQIEPAQGRRPSTAHA